MMLCLSARMFLAPGETVKFEIEIGDFIRFAKDQGYSGITLRPGQLDPETPADQVERIAELLENKSMVCSFVMGKPLNDEAGYKGLRQLVEHAARIGCRHIQPSIPTASGIPWLQRLCDFAAEREVRVSPQIHSNTLHDTVPHSLDLVKEVNRQNFGFNFEASHLYVKKAEPRGGMAVRALADRIFTVCIQNYRLEGEQLIPCLPGDPEGLEFNEIFAALKEIGFDGFVTHISVRYPDMDNTALCRAYTDFLMPLMG